MLQNIRDKSKGVAAWFIAGIMIIAMAAFGVGPLLDSIGGPPKAAEVNGDTIAEAELMNAVQAEKQRLSSQGRNDVSEDQLRDPVLTRLILQRLLGQSADSLDLGVSDQVINQEIIRNPAFAGADGYDPQRFKQVIAMQGMSAAKYRNSLVQDFKNAQYLNAITRTGVNNDHLLDVFAAVMDQQRRFEYTVFKASDYAAASAPSKEEIKKYYDDNQSQFMAPESETLKYIMLDRSEILKNISVSDADLKAEYEQTTASFKPVVERHVAHILIASKDDGSDKTAIEAVEKGLAAGTSFADLAKKYSDDFGTADKGGDLGNTDGNTFDPAFESAAAELKVGAVSGPVKTQFGTHFIKLISSSTTKPKSFAEMKSQLVTRLTEVKAEKVFNDKVAKLREDAFQVDTIEDLAKDLGLTVKVTDSFTHEKGTGVADNADVRKAGFSDTVLEDKLISDVIDYSATQSMVVALDTHTPDHVKPLADVTGIITKYLTQKSETEAASAAAKKVIEDVDNGMNFSDSVKKSKHEWHATEFVSSASKTVPADVLNAAWGVTPHADGSPVTQLATSPAGDAVVIHLTKVKNGSKDSFAPQRREQMHQFLSNLYNLTEQEALMDQLQVQADIDRK